MPKTPAQVVKALQSDRRDALRVVQQKGLKGTRQLLKSAHVELAERLDAVMEKSGEDTYTAAKVRAQLEQVKLVEKRLTLGMRGLVLQQGEDAAGLAVEHTVRALVDGEAAHHGAALAEALPLREASMLDEAVVGVRASILRRLGGDPEHPAAEGILARYGEATVGTFEQELRMGLLTGRTWEATADRLEARSPFLAGQPRFWAERIVRTETMGAYNRAGFEATREADEQLGDAVKILVSTFDDRTGADSIDVHGQIRRPEEAFESWFGLFQHPPDRPNDRAVVVPHRISWPIPPELAWRPRAEVLQRWKAEKRKGAPPPRPKMTTVPLSRFGAAPARAKGGDSESPGS